MLTKKVAELEAGLSALLSGQAIPPAAAAALIAAISKMGVPSSQLIQALSKAGVKASSLAGAAASRGGSRGPGSRHPSEGAVLAAADGKRAASNEAEAKPQGAAARQAADELDRVIQTINQVSDCVDASHSVSVVGQLCGGKGARSCRVVKAEGAVKWVAHAALQLLTPSLPARSAGWRHWSELVEQMQLRSIRTSRGAFCLAVGQTQMDALTQQDGMCCCVCIQAQSQYESPAQQKCRQKQEGHGGKAQQPLEATPGSTGAAGSASDNTASPPAPAPSAAPSKAPQTSQANAKEAHTAPEPASVAGAATAAAAFEQPAGVAAEAPSDDQEDAQERQESEEDLKRATGAFDAAKFEAYSHKVG